jgi:hypothetical protein
MASSTDSVIILVDKFAFVNSSPGYKCGSHFSGTRIKSLLVGPERRVCATAL